MLSKDQALTPMMQQYFSLKGKVGNAVLFFRMGDFYEIFDKDALEVAPKLGVVLTSREKSSEQKVPFCGVPHHSVQSYILKLLKQGYKVALADQIEASKEAKGIVKRDIIKIITPGSISELDGLDKESLNYLMAIYEDPSKKTLVCSLAEVSTGELRLGELKEGESEILSVVEKFKPSEILARKFFHKQLQNILASYKDKYIIEPLPEAPLRNETLQKELIDKITGTSGLESQPCGKIQGGSELISALVYYLQSLKNKTDQFISIRPLFEADTMKLDEIARRDLELFQTTRNGRVSGSLFGEINKTLTPMGTRKLKDWIGRPLLKYEKIYNRHIAVKTLLENKLIPLEQIRAMLKNTADLERLFTRVLAGVSKPQELALIKNSLIKASKLSEYIPTALPKDNRTSNLLIWVVNKLGLYTRPLNLLDKALLDAPGNLGSGSEVFRKGFNYELDKLNELAGSGSKKVSEYEKSLREKTNINSLKIKHHKTFGLLIEVTKTHLSKVPQDFIRKQTMVNNERFITAELIELGEMLSSATENALIKEDELYKLLLQELSKYKLELKEISSAFAVFDVIQSFAFKAKESKYKMGELSKDKSLRLFRSRHPVVEGFVGRYKFISNDIIIAENAKNILITGPNMAGKSTVMRQVALSAILNQIGSFIPAEKGFLPIFDRIFTRVGASDDLSQGQSTFMIEMSETSQILRHATHMSLVLLDEVGRGTSTQDGLAIASAILEELCTHINCYCLFATHYHELIPLSKKLPNIKTMQTEVIEQQDGIIFTHRLIKGASGSSFGIEVAKLAGIPDHVIEKAKTYLNKASKKEGLEELNLPVPSSIKNHFSSPDLGLKEIYSKVDPDQPHIKEIIDKIENLKIFRMTPLQALNVLNDLKNLLDKKEQLSLFDH